jgi:hypothetical protein
MVDYNRLKESEKLNTMKMRRKEEFVNHMKKI